jgi:hypothetical protein
MHTGRTDSERVISFRVNVTYSVSGYENNLNEKRKTKNRTRYVPIRIDPFGRCSIDFRFMFARGITGHRETYVNIPVTIERPIKSCHSVVEYV